MKPSSAALLYWSPTKTTRKILRSIAAGMKLESVEEVSLTHPSDRHHALPLIQTDILLVGMPVYEERLPSPVVPLLDGLHGTGQPAVPVAVYGNVGAGIVLQQLSGLLTRANFHVIAGASFVAEHSFSHSAMPIAAGRPNEEDLRIAGQFGLQLLERLGSAEAVADLSPISPPGRLPFKARVLPKNSARLFTQTPRVDLASCTHCNACVAACPMGAIAKDTLDIDETLCLRCFACVRTCQFDARSIVLRKRWLVHRALRTAMRVPQDPRLYL